MERLVYQSLFYQSPPNLTKLLLQISEMAKEYFDYIWNNNFFVYTKTGFHLKIIKMLQFLTISSIFHLKRSKISLRITLKKFSNDNILW